MLRTYLVACLFPAISCGAVQHHPQVDLGKWTNQFPIESFETSHGSRRFSVTSPDDPLNLWKAQGTAITSPADLSQIELVRRNVGKRHNLGTPVPADVVLWRTGPPQAPYLTKLGGTPHREATRHWPSDASGIPFTFVAQFCFLDSMDIVAHPLPGEVMLIFFRNRLSNYLGEQTDVHIEWSDRVLADPLRAEDCPRPGFPVPQLAGVLHRSQDYPEGGEAFRQEGHYHWQLFAVSKATKIGREACTIYSDPRRPGDRLLCTLNSLEPNSKEWLFLDVEKLSGSEYSSVPEEFEWSEYHNWGNYRMMFGDRGCTYFLIDANGKVRWESQSY